MMHRYQRHASAESMEDVLGGVELLGCLLPSQRHQVEKRANLRHFKRGEVIYAPGEPSTCLYVVKAGRVKLSRQSSTGREVAIHLLDAGEPFGEESLLDEPVRTMTAQSLADTQVLQIPASPIRSLLEENLLLNRALLRLTARRKQDLACQVDDLAFKDVSTRLASCLLDLYQHHGSANGSGEKRIAIPLTHEELGHLIGSTRETVSLAVDQLRRAGLIQTRGRTYILTDEDALRGRASG